MLLIHWRSKQVAMKSVSWNRACIKPLLANLVTYEHIIICIDVLYSVCQSLIFILTASTNIWWAVTRIHKISILRYLLGCIYNKLFVSSVSQSAIYVSRTLYWDSYRLCISTSPIDCSTGNFTKAHLVYVIIYYSLAVSS